jgi:hypothetical protein
MAKPNYRTKSTISMKQFISEFGEGFSDHMKEKLMELESRSFLTRKEFNNRFDLKHVEHIQYDCVTESENNPNAKQKEYSYAQFEVIDGVLYFSENCLENNLVMQSPMVSNVYNALNNEGAIVSNGSNLKQVDDENIDYIVDSILSSCPDVSKAYLDIIKGMVQRANNK